MSKKKKQRPEPQSLGLPPLGVETHAHLDMEHFAEDLDQVFIRARESGVAHIVNVFLGPKAYRDNVSLFAGREDVSYILGMHPHDASACDDGCLADMEECFRTDATLKALGETGLDYFYDHSPRDVQQRVFREQLELAKELDIPAVIHCRDALEDALTILDDAGYRDRPLLWHCFGGDAAMARELLDRGWSISIPGPVTFPKSVDLQEAVTAIPLDRMVLETDCPYLTPAPYRGKRNEPAYLAFTAAKVAELKGLDPAAVWSACADTARTFFSLPEKTS